MKHILSLFAALALSVLLSAQTISSFPYFNSFEHGVDASWSFIDADSCGFRALTIELAPGMAHSGTSVLYSLSGSFQPNADSGSLFVPSDTILDHEILTPFIAIPQNATTYLSVQLGAFSADDYPHNDQTEQILLTGLTDGNTFIPLDTLVIPESVGWSPYLLNLTPYAGQRLKVVFIHVGQVGGGQALLFDDLAINSYANAPHCTPIVSQFPYFCGFEDDAMACWETPERNGQSFGIEWGSGHQSGACVSSYSWNPSTGDPFHPGNFLISPAFQLPSNATDITLSWYVAGQLFNYAAEQYDVFVSPSKETAAMSQPLFNETLDSQAIQYSRRTLDLSSFAGQTVYVAFRHHGSSNQSALLIDDIALSLTPTQAATYPRNPSLSVSSRGLIIHVSGLDGQTLAIYDALGRNILAQPLFGPQSFTMPHQGLYLLTVDGAMASKVLLTR